MVSRARLITVVAVVLVAVPLAAGLAVFLSFRAAIRPPDVAAEARSREARAAADATATRQDAALAAVAAKAPDALPLAESVQDRCVGFFTFLRGGASVDCSRQVVRYLAFDGDRRRQQAAWEPVLVTGDATVTVEWTERPALPVMSGEFDHGRPAPVHDDQVTLVEQPVDKAAVYQQAYARHRYVVAVTVISRYYPAAPR